MLTGLVGVTDQQLFEIGSDECQEICGCVYAETDSLFCVEALGAPVFVQFPAIWGSEVVEGAV